LPRAPLCRSPLPAGLSLSRAIACGQTPERRDGDERQWGSRHRPWAWRDHVARGEAQDRQALERFFGQKVSYRLEPEDFQTSVEGALGLAWSVFLEAWQDHGHPPEQARVRFSKVLTKSPHGWQVLLYHRDIQPFTEDGWYPKALTVGSPDQ
jgi:hypothetical protein